MRRRGRRGVSAPQRSDRLAVPPELLHRRRAKPEPRLRATARPWRASKIDLGSRRDFRPLPHDFRAIDVVSCGVEKETVEMKSPRIAGALLVAMFALAAPAMAALAVGGQAPAFTLQASQGGNVFTFNLADALKKGPVVLYF